MAFGDKPSIVARDAAVAAAQAAAAKAGTSGVKTSEFWVSVLAAAGSVACLAFIPTPFGAIAAAGVAACAGVYANSRGNVKAALGAGALSALHGVAVAEGNNAVGQMAGGAEAIVGAAAK